MTGEEALRRLSSLGRLGMRFGLERMQRALEALGHPERSYRILHVAGTNGKGSTCAFAASLLRRTGERVGLYTSPHLVRFHERIEVAGERIDDADLAAAVEALEAAVPDAFDGDDPMTFFEAATAVALWHFARRGVTVAVVEVGLGGRLDATNAADASVAVITRIGLDHTQLLGSTLTAIAREKAGIFKPASGVVLARQPLEALEALAEAALARGLRPRIAGAHFALEPSGVARAGDRFDFRSGALRFTGLKPSLAGPHQRENAEAALEAVLMLRPELDEARVRAGLAEARWPGRLERAAEAPTVLLDGAHNPDGARALAEAMRSLHPEANVHLVFGALADKDVAGIVEWLRPLARQIFVASPDNERALEVEGLARLCKGAAPVTACASVTEALALARAAAARDPAGIVLVAGSLYLVGEVKRILGHGRVET